MTDQSRPKLEMLERAVLELGTELYNLKGGVAKSQATQDHFVKVHRGLKQLLDEKGLITCDDFDAAIELGQALETFASQAEHSLHQEIERVKKTGH